MRIRKIIYMMGFILLFISKVVSASNYDIGTILQECKVLNGECDVIYVSTDKKRIVLLENYPLKSTVKYHSKYFVEIISSCGSPCSSSIFIDLNNNKIDSVSMPIDFSMEYLVVAYTDEKKLIVKSLFSDKKVFLDVDFSPVSVLSNAIVEFEFISKTSVKLTYLSTSKYVKKTELFSFKL